MNTPITRKLIVGGIVALLSSAGLNSIATAQTADEAAARYASVLQQIEDVKLEIRQKEVYLASQEAKMADLRAQIASVSETKEAVHPIMREMLQAMEAEIIADLPFRHGERLTRLDDVRETLGDSGAKPGEKMRKALQLYDIEISYGNSVTAYPGDNPKNGGTRYAACEADLESATCGLTTEMRKDMASGATLSDIKGRLRDGSFLHYGRLAFIFVQHDSSEAWRFVKEDKEWVQLSGSDILNARRSVRIALGESAPGVLTAPVAQQ